MNTMKKLIILLLLPFVFAQCKNQKEQVESSTSDNHMLASKIDSICRSFIDKGNTIGFSIGIAHDGEVIFSKGYGMANIESKKPATDSTIYALASISKFITTIATMKLVEEGKLSLKDKVVDHIPNFPKQKYMDEITIEHLLLHQSGLIDHEDWFDDIYINEKRVFTDEEFYAFLDRPLFFRPGNKYSYSNSGFAVLSRILEKKYRQSFHDLIAENVGEPLNSNSLGMWPEIWNHKNATMGYELTEKGIDTSLHMMTKSMKGDGGLAASVLDLLKIMKGATNGTLIKKESFDRMLQPTPIGEITVDYGLGTRLGDYSGQKTHGHSGGYKGTGWANLTHYVESGYTFAAAMNTNYSPEEIWTLRHLVMPVILNIEPPRMETAPIKNIEKYIGEYSAINRWGEEPPAKRIVSAKGDSLFWDNPATEKPGAQLFQVVNNTFSWKAYPFDAFKFHEVDGKVVACSEYLDGSFAGIWMKSTD
ncbi:MAG: serine hydrolase domain-containing protein [Saonia sp.]